MPTNVALGKNATASDFVAPFTASKAVDGNTTPASRWVSNLSDVNSNKTHWFQVDLGANYYINKYMLSSMAAAGWGTGYINSNFTAYTSLDNSTWTTIDQVSANTSPILSRTLSSGILCRFIKIAFTNGMQINPGLNSIIDFQVINTACPYLSDLVLNGGALSPTFNGMVVFNYTSTVSPATASVTFKPTAYSSLARITVNGAAVASGATSQAVNLNYGATNIPVVVTDDNGTQTYTIAVTRPGSCLSALTMNDSKGTVVALSPTFDGHNVFAYTANVGYDATNVGTASTTVTVTPTAEQSTETIWVNDKQVTSGTASNPISLSVGANNTVKVVASASGISQEYDVTVTKASSPYLSSVTGLTLSSPFVKTTYSYTGSSSMSKVSFKPVTEDTGTAAAVLVTCGTTSSRIASGQAITLTLTSGQNTVTATVTSTTGTDSRTYTFLITR